MAPSAHRRSSTVVAATVVGVALAVSACGGNNAQGLAAQACVHVHRSVAAYRQSNQPGMAAATITSLRQKADAELSSALPLAAQATSADGSWNALMTTIAEGATVDEKNLVPALQAQCSLADTNQNVNPLGPPSQNVNPQSPSP